MANEREREDKLKKNIEGSKKKLSGILNTQKRAINGEIQDATAKSNFVSSPTARNSLYASLAKQYAILNQEVNQWTIDGAMISAKDFWTFAKEDMPAGAIPSMFGEFSKKYVEDIIGEINPSAINKLVGMNAQIGGMLQNDIRVLRAAVSTTIAEGAVQGLTNPQMVAIMREKVSKNVAKFQFIDKAGRKWSAETYFSMLNQTLHANAARGSYISAATKEAGFDLYSIEGGVTGSSAENGADPCDRWAGRIISMTGSTSGYPTYQDALDAGVFHPRCVHFVRVLMPSEIAQAKKEEKAEAKEAQALQKEVALTKTLKIEADKIRGNATETAVLVDDDGNVIFRQKGDKSSVDFSDEQVAMFKGKTITHNHPRGSSFSPQDIKITHGRGLKRIEAVSTKYDYTYIPNQSVTFDESGIAYKKADDKIRKRFNKDLAKARSKGVDEYKKAIEYANANHHHLVMEDLVAQIGGTYTRKAVK